MNKSNELISLDWADLEKTLVKLNKEMPGIGRKLIAAVNRQAVKEIKAEYRRRGYKAKVQKSWGDAGYQKNLKSYANRDFSGKIMILSNAFHYRFLEFGTNHKPMIIHRKGQIYKVRGFSVPADPVLYPIANAIWRTERAEQIMQKKFEEEIGKMNND